MAKLNFARFARSSVRSKSPRRINRRGFRGARFRLPGNRRAGGYADERDKFDFAAGGTGNKLARPDFGVGRWSEIDPRYRVKSAADFSGSFARSRSR
jgi:hypothetical protein